jgi:hypothetical protein
MDPLTIAAGTVGVAVPALQCVRRLVDDLQRMVNALDAVKLLKDDLLNIDNTLKSLQAISDPQWESLGESIVDQSKSAMALCSILCDRFRTELRFSLGAARGERVGQSVEFRDNTVAMRHDQGVLPSGA